MNATARTLIVLLLGSGFAGSALAAMGFAQTTPDAQVPAHMSQKLHDDLTKAGFTGHHNHARVPDCPRQGCAGQFGS